MIPSNSSPNMTNEDIRRFRKNLARRMRGDFTEIELKRMSQAEKTYNEIILENNGKNPILGF